MQLYAAKQGIIITTPDLAKIVTPPPLVVKGFSVNSDERERAPLLTDAQSSSDSSSDLR